MAQQGFWHPHRDVTGRGCLRGDGVPPRHPVGAGGPVRPRLRDPALDRLRKVCSRCASGRPLLGDAPHSAVRRPAARRIFTHLGARRTASACCSGTAASPSPCTPTPSTISTSFSLSRRRRAGAMAGRTEGATSCRAWPPWRGAWQRHAGGGPPSRPTSRFLSRLAGGLGGRSSLDGRLGRPGGGGGCRPAALAGGGGGGAALRASFGCGGLGRSDLGGHLTGLSQLAATLPFLVTFVSEGMPSPSAASGKPGMFRL